jgi:hypothetical protein
MSGNLQLVCKHFLEAQTDERLAKTRQFTFSILQSSGVGRDNASLPHNRIGTWRRIQLSMCPSAQQKRLEISNQSIQNRLISRIILQKIYQ